MLRLQQSAVTRDGVTTTRGIEAHPQRARIEAHEAVHRAQHQAGSRGAPRGTTRQLEEEADAGADAMLAGQSFAPRYAPAPGQELAYPLLPDARQATNAEISDRVRLDPRPFDLSSLQVTQAMGSNPQGDQQMIHEVRSDVTGQRGTIHSVTRIHLLRLARPPQFGPSGPWIESSEMRPVPHGPSGPSQGTPISVSYDRDIVFHDRDGRDLTVGVHAVLGFTEEVWARELASRSGGRTPDFETLLHMQGEGQIAITLRGRSAAQPYHSQYVNRGLSLSIQLSRASTELGWGTGLLATVSSAPATFVLPGLSAGAQFESIEQFLAAADAPVVSRRIEEERRRQAARHSWLERFRDTSFARAVESAIASAATHFIGAEMWLVAETTRMWNTLPAPVRGVLTALARFGVIVGTVLVVAAVVVEAVPALTIGAVALVIGGLMMAGSFVTSLISRAREGADTPGANAPVVVSTAILDVVGLTGFIEAITDRSVLSDRPLDRTVEERWDGGTSGLLQMLGVALGLRSALRARPPTVESPPPLTAELTPAEQATRERMFREQPHRELPPLSAAEAAGLESAEQGARLTRGQAAVSRGYRARFPARAPRPMQPVNTLDAIYRQAAEAAPELRERANEIAQQHRGQAQYRRGLKSRARAQQKIDADYHGDPRPLVDVTGSRVVFDSVADLYTALDSAEVRALDIVGFKDRLVNPVPSGFRDVLLNVRLRNGHIAELRLALRAVEEVSIPEHIAYEARRTIRANAETSGRPIEPAMAEQMAREEAYWRSRYTEAYARSLRGDRSTPIYSAPLPQWYDDDRDDGE